MRAARSEVQPKNDFGDSGEIRGGGDGGFPSRESGAIRDCSFCRIRGTDCMESETQTEGHTV